MITTTKVSVVHAGVFSVRTVCPVRVGGAVTHLADVAESCVQPTHLRFNLASG